MKAKIKLSQNDVIIIAIGIMIISWLVILYEQVSLNLKIKGF